MLSQLFGSQELLHIIKVYGYITVTAVVGIESIGIPLPGETILVAAGIFAGAGDLSVVWVITSASIGAIIGDNIGYTIGKHEGYTLLKRFGKYIHIYPQHLKGAEGYFKRNGAKTVFLGRFVSFLRMWAAFLAGTNKMPWNKFLLYNALGGITWAIVYGLLGFVLGRNLPVLLSILHAIGIIGIFIMMGVSVTVFIAWRKISQGIRKSSAKT